MFFIYFYICPHNKNPFHRKAKNDVYFFGRILVDSQGKRRAETIKVRKHKKRQMSCFFFGLIDVLIFCRFAMSIPALSHIGSFCLRAQPNINPDKEIKYLREVTFQFLSSQKKKIKKGKYYKNGHFISYHMTFVCSAFKRTAWIMHSVVVGYFLGKKCTYFRNSLKMQILTWKWFMLNTSSILWCNST